MSLDILISFSLGKYSEVALLDHVLVPFLIFKNLITLGSTMI
jgi:hypothetical protein